jgi:asparagine synthase (glutamine-hydrolysing)
MDLSELGHQPMLSADGRYCIVFNGEIYNFRKLRRELTSLGYRFQSECDTEVVLNAYIQWGEAVVNKLDGMFALAVADTTAGSVFCARDRIGKKPFYYYWDNKTFIFASELKAIVAHPDFPRELNTDVLEKYLCYQYINEPDTIYKNTYKLPAGHTLMFSTGTLTINSYWDILEKYRKGTGELEKDYDTCRSELKKCLYQAVESRLAADVPVGTFLSGGIDSTLVTAIANDVVKGGVKTFTIGFDDEERNEAPFAKETANYLGTDHHELYVTEQDMLGMLRDISRYFDEPFADPSQIPTMLVSRMAKEDVTVALSGDGGDEFFCGYSMYDFVAYSQKLDRVAGIGNRLLQNPLGRTVKKKLPETAVALLENRSKDYKTQLFIDLPEKFVTRMLRKPNSGVKYKLEEQLQMEDWQERRMILDMVTYLPEDVLTKADRASMKYSLELRCPLLDTQVMEYSFCIPHQYKYHHGEKKYILKDILYDYVPKEMLDRPKNGFGVPLGKWLRSYLREELQRVSEKDYIEKQGLFCYDVIQELIAKVERSDRKPYPKILWAYYIFQLWYAENFD